MNHRNRLITHNRLKLRDLFSAFHVNALIFSFILTSFLYLCVYELIRDLEVSVCTFKLLGISKQPYTFATYIQLIFTVLRDHLQATNYRRKEIINGWKLMKENKKKKRSKKDWTNASQWQWICICRYFQVLSVYVLLLWWECHRISFSNLTIDWERTKGSLMTTREKNSFMVEQKYFWRAVAFIKTNNFNAI